MSRRVRGLWEVLVCLLLWLPARALSAAEPGVTNAPTSAVVEPTIVTSERLSVDYANNTGVFEGNVLVVDPRITVRADKMTVEFGVAVSGTNGTTNVLARTIHKIVAQGGVIIVQAEKKATSDQAEYTASDGMVVLTGHPQVESSDGTVSGAKITFWRDQKRMVVDSGSRLVLFPEELEKKAREPETQGGKNPDNDQPGPAQEPENETERTRQPEKAENEAVDKKVVPPIVEPAP